MEINYKGIIGDNPKSLWIPQDLINIIISYTWMPIFDKTLKEIKEYKRYYNKKTYYNQIYYPKYMRKIHYRKSIHCKKCGNISGRLQELKGPFSWKRRFCMCNSARDFGIYMVTYEMLVNS